jgi:hypothetical protein
MNAIPPIARPASLQAPATPAPAGPDVPLAPVPITPAGPLRPQSPTRSLLSRRSLQSSSDRSTDNSAPLRARLATIAGGLTGRAVDLSIHIAEKLYGSNLSAISDEILERVAANAPHLIGLGVTDRATLDVFCTQQFRNDAVRSILLNGVLGGGGHYFAMLNAVVNRGVPKWETKNVPALGLAIGATVIGTTVAGAEWTTAANASLAAAGDVSSLPTEVRDRIQAHLSKVNSAPEDLSRDFGRQFVRNAGSILYAAAAQGTPITKSHADTIDTLMDGLTFWAAGIYKEWEMLGSSGKRAPMHAERLLLQDPHRLAQRAVQWRANDGSAALNAAGAAATALIKLPTHKLIVWAGLSSIGACAIAMALSSQATVSKSVTGDKVLPAGKEDPWAAVARHASLSLAEFAAAGLFATVGTVVAGVQGRVNRFLPWVGEQAPEAQRDRAVNLSQEQRMEMETLPLPVTAER